MSRIETLISNGTIRQIDPNTYECGCGKVIRKNSINGHLKTRVHMEYMSRTCEVVAEECGICYIEKKHFFSCPTCKNKHCSECHPHMNKCPFCRSMFPGRSSARPVSYPRELPLFLTRPPTSFADMMNSLSDDDLIEFVTYVLT